MVNLALLPSSSQDYTYCHRQQTLGSTDQQVHSLTCDKESTQEKPTLVMEI